MRIFYYERARDSDIHLLTSLVLSPSSLAEGWVVAAPFAGWHGGAPSYLPYLNYFS